MNDNSPRRPAQARRQGAVPGSPYPPASVTDLPIDIILRRLNVVSRTGSTWSARCPHHHDNCPSLSVTATDDEKVLLHCHAGCAPEEVLGAIGLDFSALYPSPYALRHGTRSGAYTAGSYTPGDADPEHIDTGRLTEFHRASRPGTGLAPLAEEWELPLEAVERLEVGTNRGRWVIPERDWASKIVGISFRHPDGSKTCLEGSRRGLIIPTDTTPVPGVPLYLAEGASDTTALLSVGATAVGRSAACMTRRAFGWLTVFLAMQRFDDVIVLADCDDAGKKGAAALASQLKQYNSDWRVRWALPRMGYKDVRDQIADGRWNSGLRETEVLQ